MDLLKVLLKYKCDTHHVAQKLVATVPDLEAVAAERRCRCAGSARAGAERSSATTRCGSRHGEIALAAGSGRVRIVEVGAFGRRRSERRSG